MKRKKLIIIYISITLIIYLRDYIKNNNLKNYNLALFNRKFQINNQIL